MGRGLAAILPRGQGGEGLREIPVDLISPNPRQPRRAFDEAALAELAESIRARGLLQPIVVRGLPGGRYELVAGERRLRAARMAELETIPAMVRDADERDQLDMALAENMARVDLNPVEEARGPQRADRARRAERRARAGDSALQGPRRAPRAGLGRPQRGVVGARDGAPRPGGDYRPDVRGAATDRPRHPPRP
jgi:hypothetical protein